MHEEMVEVGGKQYVVSAIENAEKSYGGPAFSFTVINCSYETARRENGKYSLSRCPDTFCNGIGDTDFDSLQKAIEYADIYERMLHFTFVLSESKEMGIEQLKNIVVDELPRLSILNQTT